MKVTRTFFYSWGHRLLNVISPCQRLHGHNWQIDVTIDGWLNETGMVIDFSELQEKLHPVFAEFDHYFVLCKDDKLVPILQAANEEIKVVEFNPTSENFALYFQKKVQQIYPMYRISIRVWESSKSFAEV